MEVIRWSEATPPQESTLLQRMQQKGLSPYLWSNGPGDTYAVHSHDYEKVLYCVQGSIRFSLPDYPDKSFDVTGIPGVIDLSPGDCMILYANVRHSALVGPNGVACLEAARKG
jgi:quercetin dioxygenase-like cupin family protein